MARSTYTPRFRLLCVLGATALFSLAATALAVGPDITHSDLQDSTHYGPVGGIHAYAWGSNTCNIGDTSLSWINFGTPALAMNAYRLHNGRLIQIGLGGCKTACCVANGNGCGLTCVGTGFGLRPGCRDVYSAGFNGGQSRLGPRSTINPFDGAFAGIPAGSGDAIWRRCQVAESDMSLANHAGALYFAEGLYVCTEESPAEHLNNATHRMMNVANTGAAPTYIWSIANGAGGSAASSQVGRPAIYAWRDHGLGINVPDPSVQVVTVDVPGEGRFIVAGKPTSLNNGTWRYDYAVYNLNSHISGSSFTLNLPVGGGATITSPEFFDPAYHSGEVYDNTPWTFSNIGQTLTWSSPSTFAQAPNTNALRWGTMYNFSFISSIAPSASTGSVTIGLFRPYTFNGQTVTSIIANGLPVPTGACAGPVVAAQPVPMIVCSGGTATLTATPSPNSTGPFTYLWRRAIPSGFVTLANGATPWGSTGTLSGATSPALTIAGVSNKDVGPTGYSVVITNACGSTASTSATLTICTADYNCAGGVTVQDIFDFVGGYFAGNPRADINGVNGITTQDIFDFVGSYFGGC